LWRCWDDALFAHLPWVLPHAPIERRRFSPGEIFRTAGSFDTAKLVLECLELAHSPEVESGAARLEAQGRALMALGQRPLDDFECAVRQQAERSGHRLAAQIDEVIGAAPDAPAYWVSDLRRFLDLYRAGLRQETAVIPLDLLRNQDLRTGLGLGQHLVQQLGELCVAWPRIVDYAREQVARGRRLARPLEEALAEA